MTSRMLLMSLQIGMGKLRVLSCELEELRCFLDEISSAESRAPSCVEESLILKEGEVFKRAQGRKRIGKKNFKKRWLRLTNKELTYHRQQGKEALFSVPIRSIRGVERLSEDAFNRKNMYQVFYGEKILYIQANNCVEANEWVEIISRVSRCNQHRLNFYHPSAYNTNIWSCCSATAENAQGCTSCTAHAPADVQLDIDGDREVERIYSLFDTYFFRLNKMEEACGRIAIYQGPDEQEDVSHFTIEESMQTFMTLKKIKELVEKLRDLHETYSRKSLSSAKIGSEENPFGKKVS
ncbi:ras GTPase-activating protein 2-like [Protopterus annectens]|uniref:ras GTPase-activating protein 2-like n=1 Tax=Protopterus annectens TaxID=7888 RepID=UPI001CF9E78D|nr:ras GTPase-activating protein 2-like [Protopterus annectens]